jgi:hypothetical protein
MTPRGILAYVAGIIVLVCAGGLAGFVVLFAFALPGRPPPEGPILLLLCAILAFVAFHLVAAGLYRMLVHLYHTTSRADPVGDRRLRGRPIFLWGQIAIAMSVPTTILFFTVAIAEGHHRDREIGLILLGVLPAGFILTVSLVAFLGGLGMMVRDLFLRNREIVEKRDAERRRRLDEPEELQTEVLSPLRPLAGDLREHIREDR